MPYKARYGGSSRAITSPFIVHKTTFSCSTLPTLMWGAGAGRPFSVPSPCTCRGPSANTREESHTRTDEEMIKSPHQARLLAYPPLLRPVHAGIGSRSPLVLPTASSFVLLCHRSLPQARVHHSFLHILGHHLLPQARALHSLKLQLIQQDCTSLYTAMRLYLHLPSQRDLLIRCNSDPVGRCCPGQQHGRPLPLLPHNGQLVDRPLSSAAVGRERALR